MLMSCSSLQLMAEPMWLCIAVGSLIIGRGRQINSATGQRDRLLLDTRNKWRPDSSTRRPLSNQIPGSALAKRPPAH